MSTISVGTSSGSAFNVSSDTTGALVLQTNNGTTALTLNTAQAVGVGSTPSYGTSGQVLTSAGSAASPTWSDIPATNLASGVTGTLPVANGGTGATSLTANNVILGNGTSAVQVVAPGTSGNVLTSNGTTWTSAAVSSSSGMTLVSTQTASSSSLVEWTGLTGSVFMVVFNNMVHTTGAGVFLVAQGGTSSYITSGYNSGYTYNYNGGIAWSGNAATPASYWWVAYRDNTTQRGSGQLLITTSANITNCQAQSIWSNGLYAQLSAGSNASVTNMTRVKLYVSNGSTFSGTFSLYKLSV